MCSETDLNYNVILSNTDNFESGIRSCISDELRFERKFFVKDLSLEAVDLIVKICPFGFYEIHQPRYVNSIYFDTHNLTFMNDNISGISNRKKLRIRWYGDAEGLIKESVLEIKLKDGLAGYKKRFLLPQFNIDEELTDNRLSKILYSSINNRRLNIELQSVIPVLICRYCRRYYQSSDNQFRITIDKNINYQLILGQKILGSSISENITDIVVELKYPPELDKLAAVISNNFPFRMTKNSKYISGLERFTYLNF